MTRERLQELSDAIERGTFFVEAKTAEARELVAAAILLGGVQEECKQLQTQLLDACNARDAAQEDRDRWERHAKADASRSAAKP